MDTGTISRAQTLADLLERQPLAGFLALTLIALVVVAGLLLFEYRSHQKTLREVVALMTTFGSSWNRHQDLEEEMVMALAFARSKRTEAQVLEAPALPLPPRSTGEPQ